MVYLSLAHSLMCFVSHIASTCSSALLQVLPPVLKEIKILMSKRTSWCCTTSRNQAPCSYTCFTMLLCTKFWVYSNSALHFCSQIYGSHPLSQLQDLNFLGAWQAHFSVFSHTTPEKSTRRVSHHPQILTLKRSPPEKNLQAKAY